MAVAMEWVSKITTIVLEMLLPGLAGQWLDKRWGTRYLTLLGFAIGLSIAIRHLIYLTKTPSAGSRNRGHFGDSDRKTNDDSPNPIDGIP